jgi:hypothetical protein
MMPPEDHDVAAIGRDEAIAELLAVPPLDEITRRRLVAVAVDERPRATKPVGRLAAIVGVAAALVVGVLIGTVFVTRPDDPGTPTAARASDSSAAPDDGATGERAPKAAADAGAAAPALVPATPTRLGDLGTFTSLAALRDVIATRMTTGESVTRTSTIADACVARGPAGVGLDGFTAVGSATLSDASGADANPVAVLVGPSPSGSTVAVTVSPTTCTVLGTVTL